MTIEEMPSAASTPAPASETPYTVTSPMSPRTHKVGASEDYTAPSATDSDTSVLLQYKEGSDYKLALNMQQYSGRHHHQAKREDFDHRGGRARGAVQAEARDPRQHRPGRHVLVVLL